MQVCMLTGMIALLILAAVVVPDEGTAELPVCVPAPSDEKVGTNSALDEHRMLRRALAEPMPDAPMMVMLHGKGGHLSTEEYSIILARDVDGHWRSSAVGRSQIGVAGAPFIPMKRQDWVLDQANARRLESVISRTCPRDRKSTSSANSGPPPDYITETIDIIVAGHTTTSFFVSDESAQLAALVRPPQ